MKNELPRSKLRGIDENYSYDNEASFGELNPKRLNPKRFIKERYPVLSQAASAVGTPQLRNMGTLGGNLCHRLKCMYYRTGHDCFLVRTTNPCYAVDGENHKHAIFGGGPCYAVHGSDTAAALQALQAEITIAGLKG